MYRVPKMDKVSVSPTLPGKKPGAEKFDVADLYREPVSDGAVSQKDHVSLDEKLRKAYFWITNSAIITPYYDIEYNTRPPLEYRIGDAKARVTLPSAQSYSSFILLPLLNLAVRRRCLFIGGPGRGKTASAVIMALLAGYSLTEVKRAIQHGQPQMTISDLLGNPIPSDLMKSENFEDIRIAWRKWLGMRVKIIDEYNRIPTRTQSALLTVMADNYAEILDQIYECPEAAWYLTANDDVGGGTYQVIEALRDRIDVVVHALHFNTRFISDLLARIDRGIQPEKMVPPEIIFSEDELDTVYQEVLEVSIPDGLLRRLEFFAGQFEFCEQGADILEYKTKDNIKLSGLEFTQVVAAESGKDRWKDLGLQTKNGLSVRAIMTALIFVKACAYFHGAKEVTLEDMRNILPFVLHDKLVQHQDAPYFSQQGREIYRVDRIGWLRNLFDLSCAEFDSLNLEKDDPVGRISDDFNAGLEGLSAEDTRKQLVRIERLMEQYSSGRKLHGPMYDDILKLKYLHQRYSNYLRWLEWKG